MNINSHADYGKAFQTMKIMDNLEKELIHINDIATTGVKHAVQNKTARPEAIIKELKESIIDGYGGLSPELSGLILKF